MKNNNNYAITFALLVFCNTIYSGETERDKALRKYSGIAYQRRKGGFEGAVSGAKKGAATGGAFGAAVLTEAPNYMENKEKLGNLLLATGFFAAGGAVTSILNDVIRQNSSPAWLQQIDKLIKKQDMLSNKVLYVGVPSNQRDGFTEKEKGKLYLLSQTFDNTNNAFDGNHYEMYLMPTDDALVSIFLKLNEICSSLKEAEFDKIEFIALSPRPGVTKTKAFWYYKNLPRIIVGFKKEESKDNINSLQKTIDLITKVRLELEKYYEPKRYGLNIQPRYSQKIDNLIYVGFGSGDYKDSPQGKDDFTPKITSFYNRIFGYRDVDRAYSHSNQQYDIIK